MPCDAVIRAELSEFAQNPNHVQELKELIELYYTQTYHAGLNECLRHFWPDADSDQTAHHSDLLVLTGKARCEMVHRVVKVEEGAGEATGASTSTTRASSESGEITTDAAPAPSAL